MMHAFEKAGLGYAPFKFVGMTENVHRAPDGLALGPGGTCAFCGTGIRYEYRVKDATGKTFVVGSDCIDRINDEVLANEASIAKRMLEAGKRKEKREAKYRAQEEARLADLQAQRDRNGGMTDYELEEAETARKREAAIESMKPVIDALAASKSDFGTSVAFELNHGVFPRGRGWDIACDIYAKSVAGRRGTIAYDAALQDAGAMLSAAQAQIAEAQ